jgi:ABC-type phosphate transport system substrate-binding protein
LVLNYYKQKMTTLPKTLASEDDAILAKGVAARPAAVGFFGNAYLEQNRETLRALPIDECGA